MPGLAFSLAHSQRRVLYSKLVDAHAGLHMFLTAARYTTTAHNVDCAVVAILLPSSAKGKHTWTAFNSTSLHHTTLSQYSLFSVSFQYHFRLTDLEKEALLGNCFTSVLAIATVRDLKFQSSHLRAFVFFLDKFNY